ncbi:MFS transporter [Herbiconiux sp. YIM B11900]|uniref:MFS transporter n=1 Tax=Herbiconiux sp. YIM B11900 TaxID=3404131 RepID=UPI003F851CAE
MSRATALPTDAATGARRGVLLAFAGLGVTAATVPAILPSMALEFSVSIAEVAPAIPAVFFGVLAGVLGAPLLRMRFALPRIILVGALLQALGLAGVAASPSPLWFIVAAGLSGFGFGLVEVAGTASAKVLAAETAPGLLVRLTLAVALVATVTPVVVLVSSSFGAVRLVAAVAAVLQVVVALVIRRCVVEDARGGLDESAAFGGRALPLRTALMAVAVFCYVGVETILSGWSAATVSVELGTSAAVAALGTSAFWLLISLGRFAGALADRRWTPRPVTLVATAGLAAALIAATLTSGTAPTAAIVLLAAGVFFAGPCYALLLGLGLAGLSAARSVPVASGLVALGAAGGAAIPLAATLAPGSASLSPFAPAMIAAMMLVAAVTAGTLLQKRALASSLAGSARSSS